MNRANDWLRQAENDMLWAKDSMEGGHWAQVCFTAQQIGEKALKAVALSRGSSEVRSHSLVKITDALGIDGDLETMGRRLDLYYISARYPDAFAEGAPYEFFDRDQAEEALRYAQAFLDRASSEIRGFGVPS